MSRYAVSISTPMSADEAFAYLADVTRFPEWDPSIIRVVQVVGTKPEVGSTYDLTIKTLGTSTMRYRISRLAPPRRMVIVSKRNALLTSADEVRVEPSASGSVVSYDAHLNLKHLGSLFDPLLQLAFDRIASRAAEGLRRVLGGTTLEKTSGHPPPAPQTLVHP